MLASRSSLRFKQDEHREKHIEKVPKRQVDKLGPRIKEAHRNTDNWREWSIALKSAVGSLNDGTQVAQGTSQPCIGNWLLRAGHSRTCRGKLGISHTNTVAVRWDFSILSGMYIYFLDRKGISAWNIQKKIRVWSTSFQILPSPVFPSVL